MKGAYITYKYDESMINRVINVCMVNVLVMYMMHEIMA